MNITFKQFREKLNALNTCILNSQRNFDVFVSLVHTNHNLSIADAFYNQDFNEIYEAFFPDVPKLDDLTSQEQKFCAPNKKSKYTMYVARILSQMGLLK